MRRASIIVFSALALLLTAGGARGEEEQETLSAEQSRRRSAEILLHTKQAEAQPSWLSHHVEHIRFHRQTGLAYTRPVTLAERDLEFSLRGPALDRKRVGLSFEISF